jgi:tellurite resistance protein/uncharacterized protein (DUF697 family)
MSNQDKQAQALASITLMAALADGTASEVERDQLKRVFSSVGVGDGTSVYQRVQWRQTTLDQEIEQLGSEPAVRRQAYDAAVTICNADGESSADELAFLTHLRQRLGIDESTANAATTAANEIAVADVASAPTSKITDADADKSIAKYAILAAALELLPQSLATVGILPIQTKMIYDVSRNHGFTLDRRQIVDFIGVLGIGGAGQVVEGIARKLFGGIMGKVGGMAGKSVGGLSKTAAEVGTGAVMTFATTYALGQVARRYYAQNRSISVTDLKQLLSVEVERARGLYDTYAPQIRQKAGTLSVKDLPGLLRGTPA